MSATAASKFRSIRDFPELVDYLGDELDWPIATDDFEELTFEYSATELGLDEKTAPKFLEIRRLRPLDKDQPWGIFFIRFDDNKLPVVALRRLLSKLVLNKRSTSNSGDRASWHESDLLLISQTGNLGTQSISFAHFAANPEKTDLPILKVLGWDDDDTGLKIDYVIETLREKLVWPDDPTDSDAWRSQWREAFTLKNREVIQSSKEMAERLGQLALAVRTRLREVLAIESQEGPIHKLMSVFKENLISDLDTDSFSDMYAQTIAYGLLSARIINPKANTADAAHTQIPITNPFLRDLMESFLNVGGRSHSGGVGLDFDELGINEVVDLLDNTNMEAVLRDFGDRNQKEDPVMHFFEGFLHEYDSKIRKDRGVFYTPQPVVSFIVRSVDEQLRTEFGLEDGLADTTTWGELAKQKADVEIPEGTSPNQAFVQILDPATGTGTFPVEVIDLIYKTMIAKWQAQGKREAQIKDLWNEYVPEHLLPRVHGYELMMAPYAIAHMKIGLKLYETGYRFKSEERARVYLTNALEPAQDNSGTLAFAIPALASEVEAVTAIKRDRRFTVVIGNPPYSRHSSNPSRLASGKFTFIGRLIEDFKEGCPELFKPAQGKYLQDDYIKFLRLFLFIFEKSQLGVLGIITSHGYLDNPTFRGVRRNIVKLFQRLSLLDLHGNANRGEKTPDGGVDENVFAIRQGVSILVGSRLSTGVRNIVQHSDMWGARKDKYAQLGSLNSVAAVPAVKLEPQEPNYLLVPFDESMAEEYSKFISLRDIFYPLGDPAPGILTTHDSFAVAFTKKELIANIENFVSTEDEESARVKFKLCTQSQWNYDKAKRELLETDWKSKIIPIAYRPFDTRYTIYDTNVAVHLRSRMTSHMLSGNNIALITSRMTKGEDYRHAQVTRLIPEVICLSSKSSNNGFVFPLWMKSSGALLEARWTHSFAPYFLRKLGVYLGTKADPDSLLPESITAEEIFQYLYGLLYSPTYRSRYKQYLKLEFPKLPLPSCLNLFKALALKGGSLISAQLNEGASSNLKELVPTIGVGDFQVEKISYLEGNVWINSAKTQGFSGIPEEVWSFHIGGYQVCKKWLQDRQAKGGKTPSSGRLLTYEDIEHYQKIVVSLSKTIRIMTEIDEVIDAHGGWPNAFITANP